MAKVGKTKFLMRTETNPAVYAKVRKMYLEDFCEIRCSRCPYHRVENLERTPRRSWKGKRRTQYKVKGYLPEGG